MSQIHPTAVIGERVRLGSGNRIGPFTVILGEVTIGDDNWIGPFATIGTPAEVRTGEHAALWDGGTAGGAIHIGSRNTLREYIAVHAGYAEETHIGDDCYLMNKTYIAHDCELGDGVTMAAGSVMGGHTHVGAGANIGLNAALHQRSIIGPGAMVGMSSVVTRAIPPHAKAFGSPARVRGVNRIGMQRGGIDDAAIAYLEAAYADDRQPDPADVPASLADHFAWWHRETSALNAHG